MKLEFKIGDLKVGEKYNLSLDKYPTFYLSIVDKDGCISTYACISEDYPLKIIDIKGEFILFETALGIVGSVEKHRNIYKDAFILVHEFRNTSNKTRLELLIDEEVGL